MASVRRPAPTPIAISLSLSVHLLAHAKNSTSPTLHPHVIFYTKILTNPTLHPHVIKLHLYKKNSKILTLRLLNMTTQIPKKLHKNI